MGDATIASATAPSLRNDLDALLDDLSRDRIELPQKVRVEPVGDLDGETRRLTVNTNCGANTRERYAWAWDRIEPARFIQQGRSPQN